MKLLVIGATGRRGRRLVEHAVAAGHEVVGFATGPDPSGFREDQVTLLSGDVLDVGAVKDAVAGSDAVVYALGVAKRTTTTLYSDGIRNVVEAMDACGVRRLVCLSTLGLSIGLRFGLVRWFFMEYVVERIMRNIYLDQARMEDELAQSDLDYTVIRAGRLTNRPPSGSYRVEVCGRLRRPRWLSRADLADYVLHCLGATQTYRTTVEIAR